MTNADKYLKDEARLEDFAIWLSNALFESRRGVDIQPKAIVDCLANTIKPILTSDEKVILNFIKNFDYIGRDENGLYYKLQDKDVKEKTAGVYNLTTNLFQFIKNGEEYSIKELLGDEEE